MGLRWKKYVARACRMCNTIHLSFSSCCGLKARAQTNARCTRCCSLSRKKKRSSAPLREITEACAPVQRNMSQIQVPSLDGCFLLRILSPYSSFYTLYFPPSLSLSIVSNSNIARWRSRRVVLTYVKNVNESSCEMQAVAALQTEDARTRSEYFCTISF